MTQPPEKRRVQGSVEATYTGGPVLKPLDVVRHNMRRLRDDRGWSAAHLATELRKLGLDWNRSIVANFESGRRDQLDWTEVLALAYVLGVSPIHLLLPAEPEFVAVVPEVAIFSDEVAEWLRGDQPAAGQHPGWFAEEVRRRGGR